MSSRKHVITRLCHNDDLTIYLWYRKYPSMREKYEEHAKNCKKIVCTPKFDNFGILTKDIKPKLVECMERVS